MNERASKSLVVMVAGLIAAVLLALSIGTSMAGSPLLWSGSGGERLAWANTSAIRAAEDAGPSGTLYQFSTLGALMEGSYDGALDALELKRHGDFGLGTFDRLDGEMVVTGGEIYQIRSDGKAYPVDDSARTPFAAVAFFTPERAETLDQPVSWAELSERIDSLLPTRNLPYAVRVEGEFGYLKARSVPAQTKPYPRLPEVTANQPTFDFLDSRGNLVGFRLPDYMAGINVPGYHLHFLTEDRSAGGHVLEANLTAGRIEVESLPNFQMALPTTEEFGRLNLSGDKTGDIQKVER